MDWEQEALVGCYGIPAFENLFLLLGGALASRKMSKTLKRGRCRGESHLDLVFNELGILNSKDRGGVRTRSHSVAQEGFELVILLPVVSECFV